MKKKAMIADGLYYKAGNGLVSAWTGEIEWLSTDEYEPAEPGVYPAASWSGQRGICNFDGKKWWWNSGTNSVTAHRFLPIRLPAPPKPPCNKPLTCQKTAGHPGDCE